MLEDFRLKIFATVARRGSFTKAARELGISQPAVTQNISTLEKTIGAQLLERSAAGLSLTARGRIFLYHAEKIISDYDNLNTLFCAETALSEIRIHADAAAREYLLPKIADTLRTARPLLRIDLTDNAESADINIISSFYKRGGTMTFTFQVLPETHPLTPVIKSIIDSI